MEIDKEEVFNFLDALRESGVTNMFGASPYIAKEFEVDSEQSRKLLVEWMETFEKRHPEGR